MTLTYTLTDSGIYTAQAEDSTGTYETSEVSNSITYMKWLKINNQYLGKLNGSTIKSLNGQEVRGGRITSQLTTSDSEIFLTSSGQNFRVQNN